MIIDIWTIIIIVAIVTDIILVSSYLIITEIRFILVTSRFPQTIIDEEFIWLTLLESSSLTPHPTSLYSYY